MFYRPADGHGLPHDPFKAIVAPRPIGWISTVDTAGVANLAPYSFFNGCGEAPPLVMFAQSGRKTAEQRDKDSIANIRATGEFAANLVGEAQIAAMNLSSGGYPAGQDEFVLAGLAKAPCRIIAAPRVADSAATLECRLVRLIDDLPNWHEGGANTIVIGEVVGVHIAEGYLTDGQLDPRKVHPVARMGYRDYATVTEVWSLGRPPGAGQ